MELERTLLQEYDYPPQALCYRSLNLGPELHEFGTKIWKPPSRIWR